MPLETLVRPTEVGGEPRFHKNLQPVSYVFGELSGSEESPVYALMALTGSWMRSGPTARRCPASASRCPPTPSGWR